MTSPNPFDDQTPIEGIRHIVLVGSGKGGVGKSTVAANLALALEKTGAKVGLLDADLYGPSLPRMFGALQQKPEIDRAEKIYPIQRHGIKLMSIGFLVDEDQAVVWRGPMLFKALDQFFKDVLWAPLDYLILDLPPGTGDIVLSVAQKVPVAGAITVCTPQNLALVDAKKAIDMYAKTNIKHLGMIENMAYFIAPGQTEAIQLFPKGELDSYLTSNNIPKLAEIPFDTSISLGSEAGMPIVVGSPDSKEAQIFIELAKKLRASLE